MYATSLKPHVRIRGGRRSYRNTAIPDDKRHPAQQPPHPQPRAESSRPTPTPRTPRHNLP